MFEKKQTKKPMMKQEKPITQPAKPMQKPVTPQKKVPKYEDEDEDF